MIKIFAHAITAIDRHPSLGYIGAILPTAAGFWAFVESATKIGGLISVILGISVGIVTLRVQLRHHKRLAEPTAKRK